MGSACSLEVRCVSCGAVIPGTQTMTSLKTGTVFTGFDINHRLVAAASATGIGYTQLCRFFGMVNMPRPMHQKTWLHYQKKYSEGASRAASTHLQDAAHHVREAYAEMGLGQPSDDGCLDISVSFDGSWHRRGRTSHNGIATVIEIFSGLILDYAVLSNYCQACEQGPAEDDPGYAEWWEKHEPDCQKNCSCSSAAMETKAAVIMFGRSVELHNFRYKHLLGDGDAKAHAAVNESAPYGDGFLVEKIECVNHVTKRMGTALRNLVEKQKAIKQPIGGRGKLTEKRIKQLTNYYGRAIKDHAGDLSKMEQAVWASFFHTISTDDDPHHLRCPAGKDSWCFFRRAEANNQPPRPHTNPLPRDLVDALVPVYKRLGDPQLLERCLAGKTQNSNESFHSMVWRTCPKERWAGLRTVHSAVAVCVQRYNKGSTALLDVLAELDLVAGSNAEMFAEKSDMLRVKTATRKSSDRAKQKRKKIETVRRQEREHRRADEGEVYAPGAF
ncbi:uncharacterized protein LOC143287427 [Babylonia areolata]|uniref:uncharacterized protein LOC143287427 n=1 Tax=Babylonia areolata TaxID=304850 RepID=UPI003FCF23E1